MWECHDYFSIHAFLLLVLSSSFLARRLVTRVSYRSCDGRVTRTTHYSAERIAVAGGGVGRYLFTARTKVVVRARNQFSIRVQSVVVRRRAALDTCVNGRRRRTTIVETRPRPDARTVMWTDPDVSDVYVRVFSSRHP